MDEFSDFRLLLRGVDRYYEDFEHGVISYLKLPGNAHKQKMIENFIANNPLANSSDVLEYMIYETGFFESCEEYRNSQENIATAV